MLIILGIWIVVFALSRYVSLASISASFTLPFAAWLVGEEPNRSSVTAALAALAIYKHKANIQRLIKGTENRIDFKKPSPSDAPETCIMNITILGAGAWGTALARLLHQGKNQVTLWGHIPEWLDEIRQTGRNDRFLPGIELPRELVLEPDLPRAIEAAECIVVAVPSQPFPQVTRHLADYSGLIVSVTKGIEYDTGLTMCGILAENAPKAKCAALSGPTFAIEVARDIPTAIVAASRDAATADQVQQLFNRPTFRVYTSADLLGVELGGALEERHCHRRRRGRRPGLWRQLQGRPGHPGDRGNPPAGRRLRRASRNLHRPERLGRSDGDLLLAAQPQPRFWRARWPG